MDSWRKEKKFSWIFFICTVCMCIFFILPGELIYDRLIRKINSVLYMGVYFGVLGVLILGALCAAAVLERHPIDPKALAISSVCVAGLVLAGLLFEFLYELGAEKAGSVTDRYIFLIDNSASMEENDPSQERMDAINRIIENQKDIQYAVYSFGEEIKCVRKMAPAAASEGQTEVVPGGQTPIVAMLHFIREEFEEGNLTDPQSTQMILMTDGYATDNGLFGWKINRPLKYFSKSRIRISTVGLGEADKNLLKKIADRTGGVSLMVSDAGQLKDAMQSAVSETEISRDLLSYREKNSFDWLYAVMRILFILILGLIVMVEKLVIVNNTESQNIIMGVSAAGSLLAGIVLEAGINLTGMPEIIMRLTATVLIGLTPAYAGKVIPYPSGRFYESENGIGGYSGSGGMRLN